MIATLREFLRMETAGGVLLGIAAGLGLALANLGPQAYEAIVHAPLGPLGFPLTRIADLLAPVPLGIALGLLIGKQTGVFAAVWACVKLGIAPMPEGARWSQVYGVAVLCGIGFTMSLFIGMLAFEPSSGRLDEVRIGVLVGPFISALLGYAILRWSALRVPVPRM